MTDSGQNKEQAIGNLMDRWMNDGSFKDQMQNDPASALRECGIEADEHLVAAINAMDAGSSAEELRERIVKWGGFLGSGI